MRGGGRFIEVSVSTFPCLSMGTKLKECVLKYISFRVYRLLDCNGFEM